MAKFFDLVARKILFKDKRNLQSLDDPYLAMRKLLKGRKVAVALDAGASNGRISRRLLKYFPGVDVYAFEPNPFYKPVLEDFERSERRFHPRYWALSDAEGQVELKIAASAGNTSLFKPGPRLEQYQPEGARIERVESVRAVTLDGWAKEEKLNGVQLMKFDIQGAEVFALKGATRLLSESTLLVYTEVMFNRMYEGGGLVYDIDRVLRPHGFALYDIYKPKHDGNGMLLWANAIFVHTGRLGM